MLSYFSVQLFKLKLQVLALIISYIGKNAAI